MWVNEFFAFKLCLLQFNFCLLMCQTFPQIEDLLLLKATLSLQLIHLTNHMSVKYAVCDFTNITSSQREINSHQKRCCLDGGEIIAAWCGAYHENAVKMALMMVQPPSKCSWNSDSFVRYMYNTHTHTHKRFTALWTLSETTRVRWYQKKHSPTHNYPGHQSSFICFLHLLRSMASSLFNLRALQSFTTISLQVTRI